MKILLTIVVHDVFKQSLEYDLSININFQTIQSEI